MDKLSIKLRKGMFAMGTIIISIGVLSAVGIFQSIRLVMLKNMPVADYKELVLDMFGNAASVEYVLMGFGFLCCLVATGDFIPLIRRIKK